MPQTELPYKFQNLSPGTLKPLNPKTQTQIFNVLRVGKCLFSTLADFLIETHYVAADHGGVFPLQFSSASMKVKQPGEAANVQFLACS